MPSFGTLVAIGLCIVLAAAIWDSIGNSARNRRGDMPPREGENRTDRDPDAES